MPKDQNIAKVMSKAKLLFDKNGFDLSFMISPFFIELTQG